MPTREVYKNSGIY